MWPTRNGRMAIAVLLAVGMTWMAVGAARLWGCPFCVALSNALREDLALSDHVAFAICQQPAGEDAEFTIHTFRIERSLVGEGIPTGHLVRAYSARTYQAGDKVLLVGIGKPPNVDWGPSEKLGELAVGYIDRVVAQFQKDRKLNEKLSLLNLAQSDEPVPQPTEPVPQSDVAAGATELPPELEQARVANELTWLNLAWENLESEEEWVRRDCFNLVARASVADLRVWTQQLDADEVVRRLGDERVSIEHRRFYWTVLSLCGRSRDAEFARQRIFGYLDKTKPQLAADPIGLDAAISCLLMLGGEEALQEIENKLLADPRRLHSERYAAIVALRVHAVEFQEISTVRICKALSHALDEPAIADLVIPDLARMEDWSHVPRMLELYREADSGQRYLRVPIINYLRACPLPEAKAALEECERIDPDAYRRASIIFPSVLGADRN